MNKYLWLLIGASVGAGAGFALATFLYDNMIDEEFEYEEETDEIEEDEIITEIADKKRKKKGPVDYTTKFNQSNENPDLQKLAAKYKDGAIEGEENTDDAQEGTEEGEDEEWTDSPDPTKPYLITKEAFEEEFLQHQKIYFHFYEEDDVLTQAEDDRVVTNDPEKFLGPDGLTSFNLPGDEDPDFTHIRNEVIGADYQIQLIHSSFEKKILGDKEKKSKERVRRRDNKEEVNE